jgi:hypothetical protein
METNDSSDRFLADIAAIRLKSAGRDAALLRLGAFLMPAGIVVAVISYFVSNRTDNPLDQRDAIILALIGLSLAVVGVGLFIRYSLADFFRFWMARLIHQQEITARGGSVASQVTMPAEPRPDITSQGASAQAAGR